MAASHARHCWGHQTNTWCIVDKNAAKVGQGDGQSHSNSCYCKFINFLLLLTLILIKQIRRIEHSDLGKHRAALCFTETAQDRGGQERSRYSDPGHRKESQMKSRHKWGRHDNHPHLCQMWKGLPFLDRTVYWQLMLCQPWKYCSIYLIMVHHPSRPTDGGHTYTTNIESFVCKLCQENLQ